METRKEAVRSRWVKPTLVRKPVHETLSGLGSNLDGHNGELHS